jgi:hypothetical protein
VGCYRQLIYFFEIRLGVAFRLTEFCMNRFMVPFNCAIEPRSSVALELIQGV